MKKKVGILIGGEFREFEAAHKSWGFLDDIDYDIYFSTWDVSHEVNPGMNIDIIDIVTPDRILKYFPNAIVSIEKDHNEIQDNSNKQLYHWSKLYELLSKSKKKYEIIILIRPDIFFKKNKVLNHYINNVLNDRIYGLAPINQIPPPEFIYVQDLMFFGGENLMKKFISEFTESKNMNKSIHYHLAKYFVSQDIYVDGSLSPKIDYCILRSIHRNILNSDFETIRDISINWWNFKHNKFTDEEFSNLRRFI